MHEDGSEYERGRQDQLDECTRRHIVRIADVLDAIERHSGDVEKLRSSVLEAMGHGAL